jgi:peroxiredoxin
LGVTAKEERMATAPVCDFGWKAPDFTLPATDGKTYGLEEIRGPNGTLVMFICNHCPYVTGAIDRIVADARALMDQGIGVAAICSNDARQYPEDGFDRMIEFASRHGFPFPYLHDESQEVARTWDAVCTPDFFGFDRDLGLQYRGRLDEGGRKAIPGARRELYEAMAQVAETGHGPSVQTPSMGCSIKWKAA